MTELTDWAIADAMGNLFSCPTTDVGHREDKEESGRRPTASPCNDASTSASELPSFPRIIDDKSSEIFTVTEIKFHLTSILPLF